MKNLGDDRLERAIARVRTLQRENTDLEKRLEDALQRIEYLDDFYQEALVVFQRRVENLKRKLAREEAA